jgi:hypothetical protein
MYAAAPAFSAKQKLLVDFSPQTKSTTFLLQALI